VSKAARSRPDGGTGGAGARADRGPPVADDEAAYLALVGERVRSTRLRRGMPRSTLSRDSGVSERYLAQLESGRGNVSMRLLRRIARAMDAEIADLVRDGPEPAVELTLLVERLKGLPPPELQAVLDSVTERFGRARRPGRRIALIGLRGAGKTTLGRRLGERLGLPFVQLVSEVEHEAGMGVSEILALSGQQGYRRLERRVLRRMIDGHERAVMEVGGGLPAEPASFNLLLGSCYTVWVRATPREHMERVLAQGDHRPMAGSREAMEDLERILALREPYYRKADAVLDTGGRAVEACVDALEALCAPQVTHEI